MRTELYQSMEAFDRLKAGWNELLSRSPTNVIFLTWEWQSTWWHAYQAGSLWIVAVYDLNDRLVGLGPWYIQDRDGEKVIRTIGCVDVTDYVDLIVDRDCSDAVHAVLAEFLLEHRADYDRINLCNIPEASPTHQRLPDVLRDMGFDADMVLQEVCPIIHLPDTWEDYLAMLDKKQRHELRRKIRKAESEAAVEWVVLESEAEYEVLTETFLRLMAASQPAKAEFLANEKNLAFFRQILRLTFEQNWLRLSFLRVNGEYVATYCDFDYQQHILVYNSGLDLNQYAHLSTGIVLLCYNIRAAIESGRTVFDFLRGNETYKYRMGAVDTRVYKLVARYGRSAVAQGT